MCSVLSFRVIKEIPLAFGADEQTNSVPEKWTVFFLEVIFKWRRHLHKNHETGNQFLSCINNVVKGKERGLNTERTIGMHARSGWKGLRILEKDSFECFVFVCMRSVIRGSFQQMCLWVTAFQMVKKIVLQSHLEGYRREIERHWVSWTPTKKSGNSYEDLMT